MKLTVWIIEQDDDAPCFNIIAKTKKAALEQALFFGARKWTGLYKVTLSYSSAFDLFDRITSEGGGRVHYAFDDSEEVLGEDALRKALQDAASK